MQMREPSPRRRRFASESSRVPHVWHRKQLRCHRLPAASIVSQALQHNGGRHRRTPLTVGRPVAFSQVGRCVEAGAGTSRRTEFKCLALLEDLPAAFAGEDVIGIHGAVQVVVHGEGRHGGDGRWSRASSRGRRPGRGRGATVDRGFVISIHEKGDGAVGRYGAQRQREESVLDGASCRVVDTGTVFARETERCRLD